VKFALVELKVLALLSISTKTMSIKLFCVVPSYGVSLESPKMEFPIMVKSPLIPVVSYLLTNGVVVCAIDKLELKNIIKKINLKKCV
jgi:hypothetical protein